MRTVLLVHGAFVGPWCWHLVEEGLAHAGVPTVAVELPFEGLAADVAAVRAAIDAAGGPVVLCGHSYGGIVISAAAADATDVTHLVYLSAFMLAHGEAAGRMVEPAMLAAMSAVGDRSVIDPVALARIGFGGCSVEDVALASANLRSMPASPLSQESRPAWLDRPSTYIVCTEDRMLKVDAQRRMAERATGSLSIAAGHAAFWTHPHVLVGLLARLAAHR